MPAHGLLRDLDDAAIDAIAQAYRAGVPTEQAAGLVGTTKRSLLRWIEQGNEELTRLAADPDAEPADDERTRKCVTLVTAIKDAQARFVQENLLLIRRAATEAKTRKTVTRTDKEGNQVVEVTETTGGLWTAAAWLLERRNTAEFGRQIRQTIAGPNGGPVQLEVTEERQLAEKVQAYLQGAADQREAAGADADA